MVRQVRTGGAGMGGISLLLLERGMAGLETKQMKCTGVWPSGTTFITMDDVKARRTLLTSALQPRL